MSARRFSRLQKATALVPLAILSAAWTANMTDLLPEPVAVAVNRAPARATLPDGSPLRTTALQAPASIGTPSDPSQPIGTKNTGDVITAVSATGIPAAALTAYQRAATVINDADKACHLDWTLLAAIGRVESNHGRVGGSRLTAAGIATPAILGPALTGRHDTTRVVDTDGGRYDGDRKVDRAVGPMQFIPSTWAIVGVDGDGDGQRNPQDINDAALATAVYLCSGSNLSTLAAQRAAVYRYNHSHPYVATVLGVAAAYRAGDYTSVPTDVVPAGDLIVPSTEPLRVPEEPAHRHDGKQGPKTKHGHANGHGKKEPATSGATTPPVRTDGSSGTAKTPPATPGSVHSTPPDAGSDGQTDDPATQPPATNPPTANPSGPPPPEEPSETPTDEPSDTPTDEPSETPTDEPSPIVTATPTDGDATISGTGEAGATVTVLVNGVAHGTQPVEDDGTWTVTLDTPLAAGDEVTATQTDAAGNTSAESAPVAAAATDTPSEPPTETPSGTASPKP